MRSVVLAVAAALSLCGAAAAHRGHDALTVVEIDAATGAISVTIRAAAHDVEPALSMIAPRAQQSLDDPDAVAALVAYGARSVRIWDAAGKAAPLTHVRTRLAGDSVVLVYSGRLVPPAASVTVDSGFLEAYHADAENQVNVRRGKVTKSARFVVGTGPQRISFQ